MAEMIQEGGTLMYAVVGLGALGLLITLILAGLAFAKRRVPLAIWVIIPLLVVAVGAIASWMGADAALNAVATAGAEARSTMAMEGLWRALTTDWFSRWVAAGLFIGATWGAAVGSGIAAGPEKLWTFGATILCTLFTLVGAGTLAGIAFSKGMGTEAYALAGLLLVGGLGVSFAATRRALEEHQFRVAGMRFASAISLMAAVSYAGTALSLGNRMTVFGPGSAIESMPLSEAIAYWTQVGAPVSTMTWTAVGFSALIAFFCIFSELGEIVQRYTLIDVIISLVLVVGLSSVRLLEHDATDALLAIGTHGPATTIFTDVSADIPLAMIAVGEKNYQVAPVHGGFADVLHFDKERGWVRKYTWNGKGWDDDNTELTSVSLSAGAPLLIASGMTNASKIAEALEKTPDGKGLLLLKAAEVKQGVEVPLDLAYVQVAFMPIELDKEHDLATDIYATAGSPEVYYGPTTWFGDEWLAKPYTYMNGVFKATGSKGLHVVLDERARVKGIVNSCMPVLMTLDGDKMKRTDRFCRITTTPLTDMIDEAAKVFPKPKPKKVKMSLKIEGEHNEKTIKKLLRRELGAFAFCQDLAAKNGDKETVGTLILTMPLSPKKGKVGDLALGEKNKLNSAIITKCVGKRISPLRFGPSAAPEDAEVRGSTVTLKLIFK